MLSGSVLLGVGVVKCYSGVEKVVCAADLCFGSRCTQHYQASIGVYTVRPSFFGS